MSLTRPERSPARRQSLAPHEGRPAAGRPEPITFTLAAGTLPTGLTLNANGTFSGSPTATGPFTFTIQATRGTTASGARTYTVSINAAPTIGDLTVSQWTRNKSGFSGTMTIADGTPMYAIVGGPKGLPPGMTAVLSGNTIRFTGTPTAPGTFNGAVTIEDSADVKITMTVTDEIGGANNHYVYSAIGLLVGNCRRQVSAIRCGVSAA